MTFVYPLGLLGLLAVPLLILIYILKNKHTEQVITSTYLWTLSERFLKRRNPISRLAGIISLILQILAVVFISFAIAHPVFTLKGGADDLVFVLDGSGSMVYEHKDKTRFDYAKKEIQEVIEDSANGSTYTLICASDTTSVLFEGIADKKQAISLLDRAEPSTTAAKMADAQSLAQTYFNNNPASKVYLVTDKNYESLENVKLVQVSSKKENYAVSDLKQETVKDMLVVTGKACSYENDADLHLVLEVRNGTNVITKEQTMLVAKGKETTFNFSLGKIDFESVKVRIQNKDDMMLDNESMLYNVSNMQARSVLIVSEDGFFLQRAMTTLLGNDAVTVVKPEEYAKTGGEYGLYIFESFSPTVLPSGAVWFVNPKTSVTNAGFKVQGTVDDFVAAGTLTYSDSTATRVTGILKDTQKKKGDTRSNISIMKYVQCSFERNFNTVLSYEGNPILFVGVNDEKRREAVFAFNFHESDFVLTFDFMPIMRNLLEFTFPSMVEKTAYDSGSVIPINILAESKSVRIDTPSGKIISYAAEGDLIEYALTEVGQYTLTQMVPDKVGNLTAQKVYVYGNLPSSERAAVQTSDEAFVVSGTPSQEKRDGKYDDLIILLVILAAICLADWMVYCYEQYQLR